MTRPSPSSQSSLTSERLHSLLDYEEGTGLFRWKLTLPGRGGAVKEGKIAGSIDSNGKRQIRIDGQLYFAHRLAFLWVLDRWPADEVDHINRVRDDNRWENLREASTSQNCINRQYARPLPRGVYRNATGTIYAAIHQDGKLNYLGSFATPAEAEAAYLEAAKVRGDQEFFPLATNP